MLCVARTDTRGFAIFILGLGLFTLQNEETTVAQWAAYQCVAALGAGVLLNSQLPAFQIGVRENDQATASATWGFIRSIGWVWGVAITAAILNNRINELIACGGAFGAASAAQIQHFPENASTQEPYRGSFKFRLPSLTWPSFYPWSSMCLHFVKLWRLSLA